MDKYGLRQFLIDYPGMSIVPSRGDGTILKGLFSFSAKPKDKIEISDSYQLQIAIPQSFPKEIPKITEIGHKIPREAKYHVNGDDTLCLGSALRVRQSLSQNPSIPGFTKNCLLPYLYAISHKLKYGGDFPFGELDHGEPGVIADYLNLFCLKEGSQVKQTLLLLGMKKRIANKKPCPCGCGKRLGACPFHYKVNNFRKLAYRSWFNAHAMNLGTMT